MRRELSLVENFFSKRKSFLNSKLEESKILFIYRYLSLLITSLFYFFNSSEHSINRKLFIILCLTISSIILSYLYLSHEKSSKNIKILIFIETVGNSFILIPSGGIHSPFIWYTLNTILINSVFLQKKYLWLNISIYLFTTGVITYSTKKNLYILRLFDEESNLILSFMMIIAAVQVWSLYITKIKNNNKRLQEANTQLDKANQMITKSLEHIMALYQSVYILTSQGNMEGIIKLLFDYTKKITGAKSVFYYNIAENDNKLLLDGLDGEALIKEIQNTIQSKLETLLQEDLSIEIEVGNKGFIIAPVKTNYRNYGIFGFETTYSEENILYKNYIYQLEFLCGVTSIAFEKVYLEEINERLLITEEQNRIANEIHDGVLQRLFGLSCGTYALMKNIEKLTTEEIKNELNSLRSVTDIAMKELREQIYGLSWKKSGANSFRTDLFKYIKEIRKLHNVNISLNFNGNEELLTCQQKKAFYRIICEGIGNAVRHGKAKMIDIELIITSEKHKLIIKDDGKGFNLENVKMDKSKGLGINNLNSLTEALNGDIKIYTNIGKGTNIEVIIPNKIVIIKGEEVVV